MSFELHNPHPTCLIQAGSDQAIQGIIKDLFRVEKEVGLH